MLPAGSAGLWIALCSEYVMPLPDTFNGGVFVRFARHYLVPHLYAGDVGVWDMCASMGPRRSRLSSKRARMCRATVRTRTW